MKPILLLVIFALFTHVAMARHGKGGSISYEYLGVGSAEFTSRYRITAKHYIDCDGTQFIEQSSFLGIFNAATKALIKTLNIPESGRVTIQKKDFNPCINQPPKVCYIVVTYVTDTELPDNINGYVITEQECCRIGGILNIQNSSSYGITNSNTIPGKISAIDYHTNNSPVFAQKDTVVICHNAFFSLDFSATDIDGDKLTYAFTAGQSGGTTAIRQPNPPNAPPYALLLYEPGYSAAKPLGNGVGIDTVTGIISGKAPPALGSYVIAVNVSEFRNGVLIGVSKKEVQVTVADCSLSAATLKPSYINCDDYTFHFENESSSNNISKYHWDFGVNNNNGDTASVSLPTFTYPDTGRYKLKLRVTSAAGCEDSTESDVIVYPGFNPNFKTMGSCFQSPFQFTDLTTTKYGTVNSWYWEFGDTYAAVNSSSASNPMHQYATTGNYLVSLIVATSKGCVDTATTNLVVSDRPFLQLPFRDTLICSIDTLALQALGNGNFSWSPAIDMINSNSASPLVYPKTNTTYIVTLNEKGCVARDTVQVNVLDFITVNLPPDTTICLTDTIQLRPVSAGLQYQWLPATGLSNPSIKNPFTAPRSDQAYQVIARLGKCDATASMRIHVVPYPEVATGNDTTICFGTPAQLDAIIKGNRFTWSPSATLDDGNSLMPVARPLQATSYVLTVYDVLGCPKPSRDTVSVSVLPRIRAFAGNDTLVVAGQPLQLGASGGTGYLWTPNTGLSNAFIPNPVALLNAAIDSMKYIVRVSNGACSASDSLLVKVFKTEAGIFVPSAFSPNGDGGNDILRPVLAGVKNLNYFKVFNRWGELVFETHTPGAGWDGRVRGILQPSGSFVYVASGTSYLDRPISKKGVAVLVR